MITPNGIKYELEENKINIPFDMQKLDLAMSVSFQTIGTQCNVDIALKQYIPRPR